MVDRADWPARFLGGIPQRVLAAEAGIARCSVSHWLTSRGIFHPSYDPGAQRGRPDSSSNPGYLERMILLYPDTVRQNWMRRQLSPWLGPAEEEGD